MIRILLYLLMGRYIRIGCLLVELLVRLVVHLIMMRGWIVRSGWRIISSRWWIMMVLELIPLIWRGWMVLLLWIIPLIWKNEPSSIRTRWSFVSHSSIDLSGSMFLIYGNAWAGLGCWLRFSKIRVYGSVLL